jgi:hypothetical protein
MATEPWGSAEPRLRNTGLGFVDYTAVVEDLPVIKAILLLSMIVMLLWMIVVVSELAKHIILSSLHKNFAHSQMQSFSNS